uniref:Uncharacterized protein n=1 Tax=Siphoviridae sp. ctBLh2 TaxID=2827803 RepID=A0A8S5S3A6_9CAUD|nr:MAG TPA: hypothetical protein [Siphoviridae sp. ctBLh2]
MQVGDGLIELSQGHIGVFGAVRALRFLVQKVRAAGHEACGCDDGQKQMIYRFHGIGFDWSVVVRK